MALIPLISGPQDPSQLDATINSLILQLNNNFSGSSPTGGVTAQSTAASIPGFGSFTLNTTTRAAGTTGRYTIGAPVAGRVVNLKNLSTSQALITGLFERSKTKLTLAKSTAALATARLPGVILRGLSTSAWALQAAYGPVTVSS